MRPARRARAPPAPVERADALDVDGQQGAGQRPQARRAPRGSPRSGPCHRSSRRKRDPHPGARAPRRRRSAARAPGHDLPNVPDRGVVLAVDVAGDRAAERHVLGPGHDRQHPARGRRRGRAAHRASRPACAVTTPAARVELEAARSAVVSMTRPPLRPGRVAVAAPHAAGDRSAAQGTGQHGDRRRPASGAAPRRCAGRATVTSARGPPPQPLIAAGVRSRPAGAVRPAGAAGAAIVITWSRGR